MRIVISELPFVPSTIVEPHLPESLHSASSELSFILDPLFSNSHQPPFAFVMVIFPLAFVDKITLSINQLSVAFHFPFNPVSKIIATIIVNVFAPAVPETISFFSFIPVAIGIDFTGLNIRPILWYKCSSHLFAVASVVDRIKHFAESVGVELRALIWTSKKLALAFHDTDVHCSW